MAARIYKQSAMHEAGIKQWTTELVTTSLHATKEWVRTFFEEKHNETIEHMEEKLRERDALLNERIEKQVQARFNSLMSAANTVGKARGITKKHNQTTAARKTTTAVVLEREKTTDTPSTAGVR